MNSHSLFDAPEKTDKSIKPKAWTVATVVRRIRDAIAAQFPATVWIEGQLSNVSYPASGHIYFSLVDEEATDRFGQPLLLPCAFFRNANRSLKFELEDGMKVLVAGRVTTYEGRGQYQILVQRVEPKGVGALQLAFEQMKKRLAAEGLFDESRKKPIPKLPKIVGVITSGTGSAVHDLVSKLRGHFHVRVLPVKVQGEGSAQQIANAIAFANRHAIAEVLLVGRGGGSVEDLWAFNEEPVARALADSTIPIISAVGHQDDWTIADFVADMRASTPTDAAKFLVNERQVLVDQMLRLVEDLETGMLRDLEMRRERLESLMGRLRLLHPRHQLKAFRERLWQDWRQLRQSMQHRLQSDESRLQALAGRLEALSPLAVLARGYSISFKLPQKSVIKKAGEVGPGDRIETRLGTGSVVSRVEEVKKDRSRVES